MKVLLLKQFVLKMTSCKGTTVEGNTCNRLPAMDGYCHVHRPVGVTTWVGNEDLHKKLIRACYKYRRADKKLEEYCKRASIKKSSISGIVLAMQKKLQTDDPAFDALCNDCAASLRKLRRCFKRTTERGVNWYFVRATYNPILSGKI